MKKYKIPENNLSSFNAESLPTPFPNKNSVPRLAMYKSALSHSVAPATNPERPIIDSIYSKSLIFSSDNYKSKGKVLLLDKIEKILSVDGNTYHTEDTYIYYDYGTNKVEMEIVPLYEKYYRFGYELKSELSELEVGETSDKEIYTKYTYNMDPTDGGMAYGKNINFIYNISRDVGEDAIIVSERLAKTLALNYMDEVELIYFPEENILKDIYGFSGSEKDRGYRPFPLPGEYCDKEALVCISSVGENFLATPKEIRASDHVKYVHKGNRVVDIEVYSNERIANPFMEELRSSQKNYISKISHSLNKIRNHLFTNENGIKVPYGQLFSDATEYKALRYQSITVRDLRVNDVTLKNKVYVKIKVVNNRPLAAGDKLTNRDGGKGTIADVIKDPIIATIPDSPFKNAPKEVEIDMIINATGVINRENSGQLFEKELNTLNQFLQRYLKYSNDSIGNKFLNITKWIDLAHNFELANLVREEDPKEVVEWFSDNYVKLKYDPYDNKFGFREFHLLRKFTSSLNPETGPAIITRGEETFSNRHVFGKSFYMVLENGTMKDTSIRSDGMVNLKGALSKKGASRKRHQTKYGTTATKVSDLGLSIMLNYFKPKDKGLLKNNINILKDYMQGIGLEFILKSKKGVNTNESEAFGNN